MGRTGQDFNRIQKRFRRDEVHVNHPVGPGRDVGKDFCGCNIISGRVISNVEADGWAAIDGELPVAKHCPQ